MNKILMTICLSLAFVSHYETILANWTGSEACEKIERELREQRQEQLLREQVRAQNDMIRIQKQQSHPRGW